LTIFKRKVAQKLSDNVLPLGAVGAKQAKLLTTKTITMTQENNQIQDDSQSLQMAVMVSAGDYVKEVGSEWIKVLRVDGRNIYLDYDDGLNCLDIDDIIEWKKLNKTSNG
jgi:hypothetical protein